ncbi:MAG: hypothetical protein M3R36_03135 [Bacteroidota bacterium]|nr:hypothetical protein [Bacteroidota bacterium]
MKKIFIASLIILLMFMILSFKITDDDPKNFNIINIAVDSRKMDGNNISTWYFNNGSFNRYPVTGNSGFEWPKGENKFARYASGLWMGGVVGDDTLVAISEYDYEYLPGYIDNNGVPQGKDDPLYRIYKINRGDEMSQDFLNWPFNQGAYKNETGKPFLMGNQTMFYSYTDGYPQSHGNRAGSTAPLNSVILQTNWSYNDSMNGAFDNTIFTEYRIINKGNLPWTKFYLALWADDDLGDAGDDAIGCDTNLNLGYTFNYDNNDPQYGSAPPAVGFLLLKGPVAESTGDTVKYFNPPGSNNLIIKPNSKEIQMTAFNFYTGGLAGASDPANFIETYYNFQGIRSNGTMWTNPITGQVTKFPFSGDPESGSGWILYDGGDRRFMQSIGPITVNPGDTQNIIVAQVIARGTNNLKSLSRLKSFSRILHGFYQNNFKFPDKPSSPLVTSYAPGNGKIYLSWNDSAEKISIANKFSGGVYEFQGYNIYQVNSFSSNPSKKDTVLLKSFDLRNGIKNIYDSIYIKEIQGFAYGIVQYGNDNGIQRYIQINKDTISNKQFINGTEYKFIVTAYYYDSLGSVYSLPKVNESVKNIIRVIPQSITPGTTVNYQFGDTIFTDQKDLAVMPVIFEPLKLINANYTSTFGGTNQNPNWTLTRTVNGITSTLFQNVFDFSGSMDSVKSADGLLFIHQIIQDSGIVKDHDDARTLDQEKSVFTRTRAWTYEPEGNLWFSGPDTTAVQRAKLFTNNQFQSISIGMSSPNTKNFRNTNSKIFSRGSYFTPVSNGSPILAGGPARKIQIILGQNSMAYRYAPPVNVLLTDTILSGLLPGTPYRDMVNIPFSVFAIDELDSSAGTPRRLNIAFIDPDISGAWDPDTSKLGKYEIVYILASNYDPVPNVNYTNKNPGSASPIVGFGAMDIMYAWLPRVKSVNGIPKTWTNGDKLTVSPYRPTRPDFVPGYPVKYNWSVDGTQFGNRELASSEVQQIKAFPNPYYGFSELEFNDFDEKFIYFSHLPSSCDIFIYTVDGVSVKTINRNHSDPNNTLEKWDLKNNNGSYIASGMYLVYVDCKELGSKVLKIAIFQNKF